MTPLKTIKVMISEKDLSPLAQLKSKWFVNENTIKEENVYRYRRRKILLVIRFYRCSL